MNWIRVTQQQSDSLTSRVTVILLNRIFSWKCQRASLDDLLYIRWNRKFYHQFANDRNSSYFFLFANNQSSGDILSFRHFLACRSQSEITENQKMYINGKWFIYFSSLNGQYKINSLAFKIFPTLLKCFFEILKPFHFGRMKSVDW